MTGIVTVGTTATKEEPKRKEKGIVKSIPLSSKPEDISKEISKEITEMKEVEKGIKRRKKTAFGEMFISAGADVPKQITMEKRKEEKPDDKQADDSSAKKKRTVARPKKLKKPKTK
jgi:hypothetical protein